MFNHIISLGSDCDVAMQLRRVGWLKTPSVFDWLVTPWDAMMSTLQDEGANLSKKFYLCKGGQGAACSYYHLLYWHEFPRDNSSLVSISSSIANRTRAKLLHKMARMRAACESGGCVLFIRSGIITDAPGDRFAAGARFSTREMDRCVAVIASLYPTLRFSLLCIDYPGLDNVDPAPASDPRVIRHQMNVVAERTKSLSKASNHAWDSLFAQLDYQPDFRSTPFEETLPG